jgi:hypothetical protein
MGTTPAYITRLFQTSANCLSHTMTRLATAVGGGGRWMAACHNACLNVSTGVVGRV